MMRAATRSVSMAYRSCRSYSNSQLAVSGGSGIIDPEYAFEMASSSIRFGRGVTREVGQDLIAIGMASTTHKKVCVMTDPHMATLPPLQSVVESLTKAQINFEVFDRVLVEPTDKSLAIAIDYCKHHKFDAFVAVGGGSVIDTAKAANVYMCNPDNEFLDFVNAPVGKGIPIPRPLKPLIAVPTTAGTGSETTGVSIFDHTPTGAKTGIRDRSLRPILGIIDPDHTDTCGAELTAFTGLDVLCHALESYTAVPYAERITGAPTMPQLRPAYQGSNYISDIWSGYALQQCSKYLLRAVDGDPVAREQMCLASTAAGVGFGNAGVHLCHGLSYPIASCVTSYKPKTGYHAAIEHKGKVSDKGMVPHGLSVILTAPAVFRWTAEADLDRHLMAAQLLGADTSQVKRADAGLLLADTILSILDHWTAFVPNGLREIGYGSEHLDTLVQGTLPQRKVIDVSPRQPTPDDLHFLLDKSMTIF
eukprot:CAMPEP_0175004832 /NCGR_PEP_ID=MMETSP0005-20121125/4980_1 /TAXON_ID=420556 /ORGANISM="Ochromonas sp., Strain CCMP1393" /LENGTH=475 /DNA_ID=CAMNT_0016260017 /DNA_START=205 /DNA_END=1632 /DNA_ORIENTATION=-